MQMLHNLIFNMNMFLERSQQEKNLTWLYLGLFAFLCLMLWIDTREKQSLVGGNKLLAKIIIVFMIFAFIALVVVYIVQKN